MIGCDVKTVMAMQFICERELWRLFFGSPSLTLRPRGRYLALASKSGATVDMRIVDLYR